MKPIECLICEGILDDRTGVCPRCGYDGWTHAACAPEEGHRARATLYATARDVTATAAVADVVEFTNDVAALVDAAEVADDAVTLGVGLLDWV